MPKIEPPKKTVIDELLGQSLISVWDKLQEKISTLYNLNVQWHSANKGKSYELKYQKSGKTIVSLFPCYPDEDKIGVMIIFGEKERNAFELARACFCEETCQTYDTAKTYRDGKWVMFTVPYEGFWNDFPHLLSFKRKPDKIPNE